MIQISGHGRKNQRQGLAKGKGYLQPFCPMLLGGDTVYKCVISEERPSEASGYLLFLIGARAKSQVPVDILRTIVNKTRLAIHLWYMKKIKASFPVEFLLYLSDLIHTMSHAAGYTDL